VCLVFQDFHKMRPERLQAFCSSILFGIKIDGINLFDSVVVFFVFFFKQISAEKFGRLLLSRN